ncbi:MAG: sigma-54-dependent transcriptional regulator [Oligoflexus sp.]
MAGNSKLGQALTRKIHILHIDDDPFFLDQVSALFNASPLQENWELESYDEPDELLNRLKKDRPVDIVLLDIHLNKDHVDGLSILHQVKQILPQTLVIMCSDLNEPDLVHDCLTAGADDFLFKAVEERHLFARIQGTWQQRKSQLQSGKQNNLARKVPGESFRQIAERIPALLQSALTAIHIYGESGTGKELVSELFEAQLGKDVPFVRVHCGAIAPNLLESELFGHVKGAFTGANSDKIGLLEQADGGWVFLDEVATLPAPAQIALLRVLETHKVRSVGGRREKPIRIRVLSATNENLEELVACGKFRLDLWQRLCETTIQLKPLRERMNEFEEIAEHLCRDLRPGPFQLLPSTMQLLKAYDWSQGNVRELRNCLRAMTEGIQDGLLTPKSIPERIWSAMASIKLPHSMSHQSHDGPGIWLGWQNQEPPSFDELSQMLMVKLIQLHYHKHGKLTLRGLALQLGLPKSTLSSRLQKLSRSKYILPAELAKMVNFKLEPNHP